MCEIRDVLRNNPIRDEIIGTKKGVIIPYKVIGVRKEKTLFRCFCTRCMAFRDMSVYRSSKFKYCNFCRNTKLPAEESLRIYKLKLFNKLTFTEIARKLDIPRNIATRAFGRGASIMNTISSDEFKEFKKWCDERGLLKEEIKKD